MHELEFKHRNWEDHKLSLVFTCHMSFLFSNSYIHSNFHHDFFCVVFNVDNLRWSKRIDICLLGAVISRFGDYHVVVLGIELLKL